MKTISVQPFRDSTACPGEGLVALPILNREVKLPIADGIDPPVGRVGSCGSFFLLLIAIYLCSIKKAYYRRYEKEFLYRCISGSFFVVVGPVR